MAVDILVAEAGVDDDGAYQLSGRLQEHHAAVGHVDDVLYGGLVARVLTCVQKLFQPEVGRQADVIERVLTADDSLNVVRVLFHGSFS